MEMVSGSCVVRMKSAGVIDVGRVIISSGMMVPSLSFLTICDKPAISLQGH